MMMRPSRPPLNHSRRDGATGLFSGYVYDDPFVHGFADWLPLEAARALGATEAATVIEATMTEAMVSLATAAVGRQ